MASIVLITGGARSGKSTCALELARGFPAPRAYVATSSPLDDEMRVRVERHRRARGEAGWDTIEEPLDLGHALARARTRKCSVVLVDCLTLWINNLMHRAEQDGLTLEEDEVERRCREVLAACAEHPGTVIFVTNEVGTGIVPDNAPARRFRDLAGRCNQVMAAGAETVTMVVCGIPLHLKGN